MNENNMFIFDNVCIVRKYNMIHKMKTFKLKIINITLYNICTHTLYYIQLTNVFYCTYINLTLTNINDIDTSYLVK
jgi:hypothetical protein